MKKIIRYRLPVSVTFPAGHPRKGEPTFFPEQIKLSVNDGLFLLKPGGIMITEHKLHTCRANYELWVKRMAKVNEGLAVIDIFYWKLPGGRFAKGNEQIVFATLDKDSGCGVQKIKSFGEDYACINSCTGINIRYDLNLVSKNDGLSLEDFKSWFKGYDLSEPMAIIHFTKFRY